MGGFKTKKEAALFTLMILLAALLLASLILNGYQYLSKDRINVNNDSLREEIVPVAKLTTYDYSFTQILSLSDSGNFLDFDNPVTTKRYVATIDGTVPIQLDVSKLTCEGHYNIDGSLSKVVVRMPRSLAGNVTLHNDTLVKYVEDNGIFNYNQVSTEDTNLLYVQAEKDQLEKVKNSGILQKADARAEELINAQIKSIHGNGVEVSFEYTE